jgi:pyridoxamine 5'-phosphate oxidase
MGKKDLAHIRREYGRGRLDEANLPADPMELFLRWLDDAQESGIPDPNAMTLSTVEKDGQPASRIVLLKKVDGERIIFYTNYNSRKARDMQSHIRVAVNFFWPVLERQVKISGVSRILLDDDADYYFRSRPYESRIAAWASPQSEEIPDRQYLEEEYRKYREKYGESEEVPRPPHWGGYAITPSRIEFWQGRAGRLHDRIEYRKQNGRWTAVRLAP